MLKKLMRLPIDCIAVGDIHGCPRRLKKLLSLLLKLPYPVLSKNSSIKLAKSEKPRKKVESARRYLKNYKLRELLLCLSTKQCADYLEKNISRSGLYQVSKLLPHDLAFSTAIKIKGDPVASHFASIVLGAFKKGFRPYVLRPGFLSAH